MKSSILAIFVAATTLGLGLSPAFAASAHNKTGNECVRQQDPNCGVNAGYSYGAVATYSGYDDRDYRIAPTMAAPDSMSSNDRDSCANLTGGGGSATPAYLGTQCALENR